MASRRAKTREIQQTSADFRVPVADVLAAFIDPADIAPGEWSFNDSGSDVVITRHRRVVLLEPGPPLTLGTESATVKA